MNKEYIQKEIEKVKQNQIQGKENARAIEQRLREISDYLDRFLGPVSEESIKEFEEKYEKGTRR